MRENPNAMKNLILILGALVAVSLLVFIGTGGNLGGTRSVESDADLPQVTSPSGQPVENSGTR